MSRLVWTYRKLSSGECDIVTDIRDRYALIASVSSFQTLWPSFERVFYVDKYVYEKLLEWKISHLWDRIEIVDFETEFRKIGVWFFAYPKIWAMMHQDQDFWIVDTDVILGKKANFSEIYRKFKANQIYADQYLVLSPEHFDQNSRKLVECTIPYSLRKANCLERSIWGGLIHYPDPKQAALIACTIFGESRVLESPKEVHWMHFEEAALNGIFEGFNLPVKPLDTLPLDIIRHIGDSGEEHKEANAEFIVNFLESRVLTPYPKGLISIFPEMFLDFRDVLRKFLSGDVI